MPDADNEDANANASAETNPPTDDAFVAVQNFAGKLFSKENAQYLWNDLIYVKALFGAFDGLIISYSTFKCYFDLACPPGTSASNEMHEWMSSPLTFLGVMAETAFIMTLSCIGNVYDEDDKNKMKATLAWFWPYFRDGFKGLKFAYRGVRNVVQIALLLGVDFQFAFLPVGVALGLIASANRVWNRNQITDPRKKYQKKNTTLLGMVHNLDFPIDYDFCELPIGLIGPIDIESKRIAAARNEDENERKEGIALAINTEENVLEYKVYSPAGDFQSGTIDLTNELLYQKRFDDQHKLIPPTLESLIAEGYSDAIKFHIAQRGHLSKPNEPTSWHVISADMGACCSAVMLEWPKKDGSNINLEPYDSGYVRVINEHGGHSGLVYAKKNKCCSLLLSELPPDPLKISLGDFDAAYVRILNEKKGFNRLYYLNKKTGAWNELQGEDKALRKYDSKIYTTNVPRDLSTQDLKKIASLTKFKQSEFKHHAITYTWEQLLVDTETLDQYDAMITETCRVRIISSQPSPAEKIKVHDLKEILIIYADGKYKIAHCRQPGIYREVLITDGAMLELLGKYRAGSYVRTEHYEQINKFLASQYSNSRATNSTTQETNKFLPSQPSNSQATNGITQALSIKQLEWITSLTKHKHREKQSLPSNRVRMASAFFGGLIDGLYTYMAAIGLVVLCPPLLGVMIGCCSLFTLLCVINRCFEEYEFQQEFVRSRLNVELALLLKEIESLLPIVAQLKTNSLDNKDNKQQLDEVALHLEKHLIPKYKQMRKEYVSGAVLSYRRALFAGLRAGLYFYGAICSIEFAAAAFCAIAMTAFPPAWIIAGFVLGIVGLIGFILHALYTKSLHVEKTEEQARCVTMMVSEPSQLEQDEVVRSGNILLFSKEDEIKIGYCSKGGTYQQRDVSDKAVRKMVTHFLQKKDKIEDRETITKPADLDKIGAFTKSLAIETTQDKESGVIVLISEPSKAEQDEVVKSKKILLISTGNSIKIGYCSKGGAYQQTDVSDTAVRDIVTRFSEGRVLTLPADLESVRSFAESLEIRSQDKTEARERCVVVMVSEPKESEQIEIIKSGKILFIHTEKGVQVRFCLDGQNYKQDVSDKEVIDIVQRFPKGGTVTQSADLAVIGTFARLLGIRSPEQKDPTYENLEAFVRTCKGKVMAEKAIPIRSGVDALYRSMEFDSLVQMRTQEVLEWFRSFFSGLSKGQKVVDYLNPSQEVDAHGHYTDSPLMIILGFIVSLFYAVVYAVRAFAKNWRGSNDVPLTPVHADDLRRRRSDSLNEDMSRILELPPARGSEPPPSPSPSPVFSSPPPPPLSPSFQSLDKHSGMKLYSELIDHLSVSSPTTTLPTTAFQEPAVLASPMHYPSPISSFRAGSGMNGTNMVLSPSPRRSSGPRTLLGGLWPSREEWDHEEALKNMRGLHRSASSSAIDVDGSSSPVASELGVLRLG